MGSETDRGIQLKKGESVDRALKRLKTKLDSEGIIEEMRRRRAFETPTERKRRKARTAVKRHRVRWRYVSEATEKKIEERLHRWAEEGGVEFDPFKGAVLQCFSQRVGITFGHPPVMQARLGVEKKLPGQGRLHARHFIDGALVMGREAAD